MTNDSSAWALHSMLGAMDNRVSEEGMKVSCTHFQCSAGAFSYLRDHFSHNYSVDMSHQILNLNINLMLGQAQECLLEKSMLDNRKSFLVARISAQVVDYYKEACRALENSETASMLGKIQKDWKKLVQMKIYYFASIAHLHMGKQAEEQQKYGERLAYLQSSMDKLNEAIKLAKVRQHNSAKKDNDFIYHEAVPALETLASVKGAPLVKALPVNPTDPSVTGPDLFAKLVPMAAHEASSLYSEEKAKLLRDVMAKIDSKNGTLEQFMDSLGLEPDSVDNLDMYSHIPPVLMEKCAALSVRPDTVKSLVQSMQMLSGVFTDVESSLKEIRDVLEADEAGERAVQEAVGAGVSAELHPPTQAQTLAEIRRDLEKYMEAHDKASFTNTELHRAMNLHIHNLRLLGGPLDSLREALPSPQLSEEEVAGLQTMKRILGKVQEMRDQRSSFEKQLRDLIQQDDITSTLVTTERADMKRVFEEQLKKYEQLKVYIDQNLAAQENILKALTEANVQYASVRKGLSQTEQQWNSTVQGLVGSYEAYEDLMKKSQEGKDFYEDLEAKASRLLERAKALCQTRAEERKPVLDRYQKKPPARPTAAKPSLQPKAPDVDSAWGDLPEELRSLPPDMSALAPGAPRVPGPEAFLPPGTSTSLPWPGAPPAALPRFPANLPPPELLARIAQFPTSGSLPGTQVPRYPGPSPQGPPSATVVPTPVRPSTTTVNTIQTPIPSYAPTPRPPPVSTGYTMPPHIGGYPQYPSVSQPGLPMQAPGQAPAVPQQQQQQPKQFPQAQAYPAPHPTVQAPQPYPHGYMPPQPRMPPHYQQTFTPQQNGYPPQGYPTPQGYMPQQAAHMMPRPGHTPPMPAQVPPPQIPPTSQAAPPTSQHYMHHPNQHMARAKQCPQSLRTTCPPSASRSTPHYAHSSLLCPRLTWSQVLRCMCPGVPFPTCPQCSHPHRATAGYILEQHQSQVDSLELPSDNEGGMSVLDARWKELQEQQEKDARQLSIAIARCYTMKNRHQDVMPYDVNRVVLQSGKDDYINASLVEELSPYCPRIIATQAPLTGTAADFWLMVYEQKVSLIVMLVSEQELEKGKVLHYFPMERKQQLSQGPITLSLTTVKSMPTHTERMISLQYREQSLKRTVVHLQFTSWPQLGLPDSKSNLLRFIQEVHGHYLHQRPLHNPVVVHCSSGVGRTGAFCLLYAAVQELEAGNGIPDLPLLVKKMRQQRKNMLQEKLHLKFCYEAVLKHAEQVLQRHGITTATCSKTNNTESQQDIVMGGDLPISSIQATIAKLSVRPPSATDPSMDPEERAPSPPTYPNLDCSPGPEHSGSPPPVEEAPVPAPSSLELLASLAPEAFSMEGGGKGKQRVTKQSFLQPAEGQGLHGTRAKEEGDPLSSLDPLWSLNKH
uniref:Tyrosine-protein phosphatase non-receptor type 23 n=1 Tax=Periophthalmus magnuspinnatus TaxID=409849 RepID=A0A3B4BE80_9GOBI